MFLAGILSWWYSKGWTSRVYLMRDRLASSADYFSINLLLTTLFSPFRQISVDSTTVTPGDRMKAFFDKLLSRCIGAIVRSFMIIFGSIFMLLQVLFGLIILLFWLIIPVFPAIGLIIMVIGLAL